MDAEVLHIFLQFSFWYVDQRQIFVINKTNWMNLPFQPMYVHQMHEKASLRVNWTLSVNMSGRIVLYTVSKHNRIDWLDYKSCFFKYPAKILKYFYLKYYHGVKLFCWIFSCHFQIFLILLWYCFLKGYNKDFQLSQ